MIELRVKVGDRLRDNDPRQLGKRRAVVVALEGGAFPGHTLETQAACNIISSLRNKGARSMVTIPLSKIHTDGKARRSGWDVVKS